MKWSVPREEVSCLPCGSPCSLAAFAWSAARLTLFGIMPSYKLSTPSPWLLLSSSSCGYLRLHYQNIKTVMISLKYNFSSSLDESPRWLISQGRDEEAIEILYKIAAVNGKPVPEVCDFSEERASAVSVHVMGPKLEESQCWIVRFFLVFHSRNQMGKPKPRPTQWNCSNLGTISFDHALCS